MGLGRVFVLLGSVSCLALSGMLFFAGLVEVCTTCVKAFIHNDSLHLVASAVGCLDRFLLGMVCLVFGLGSYELFMGGEASRKLKGRPSWLRVRSIDDLEQKVGEIIVAVMVVHLLEESMKLKYVTALDLVWGGCAVLFSAGALALLHQASISHAVKTEESKREAPPPSLSPS